MSYSRRFTRRIAVPYSGSKSVSYPASEHGGTKTVYYSGTAYEDVEVDVQVDTSPFDASVANCNDNVNGLTASVGAMNAAQCLAISENADKVSKTIIDGFFHTVRTDLSTQKAELEQVIESRLILLRQQAASLQEKQKTMSDDYARTTARYHKLFDDLNNELSARIHQIDQPVFNLVKEIDTQSDRMLHTDMVQTAITMSKESSLLQARINSATVKHHALEAMGQAQSFLTSKALSERTILDACVDGNGDERYLVPVCYMRTESEGHKAEQLCVMPDYYSSKNPKLKEQLCEKLGNMEFGTMEADYKEQLNSYVQSEIGKNITNNDEHSNRVRDLINKMLNN